MYLNRPRYFTIANNVLEKYPGKFDYALYGLPGTWNHVLKLSRMLFQDITGDGEVSI